MTFIKECGSHVRRRDLVKPKGKPLKGSSPDQGFCLLCGLPPALTLPGLDTGHQKPGLECSQAQTSETQLKHSREFSR